MGGVSAALSTTAAAPMERVKLLIQNQDKMIKSGCLFEPYKGIGVVVKNEGPASLFKGAGANILRAIAGDGVLSGFDKLQLLLLRKKFGSGGA